MYKITFRYIGYQKIRTTTAENDKELAEVKKACEQANIEILSIETIK